ncbi:MAG TPA: cyanophycin synthetase, partial [Actinomycetota bacterium]
LQRAAGDVHVGNADDAWAAEVSRRAPCEVRWFRLGEPRGVEVGYDGGELAFGDLRLGRPAVTGAGFRADAAAAAAASLAFGVDADAVRQGIASVELLPHRGQVVATAGGVRFVDDSKATNPHATLAAIEGLRDVVLIAGGLAKGVDLSPLAQAIPALAGVVAIGEAAPEVAAVFDGRVPARAAGSMDEAVRAAFDMAPDGSGIVLLAPACASQDMFRNYAERGDAFAAAARAVASEAGSQAAPGAGPAEATNGTPSPVSSRDSNPRSNPNGPSIDDEREGAARGQ